MYTPTLYQQALGDQFDRLPAVLREFHGRPDGGRGTGRFLIERGPGLIVRLMCAVARFPRPGTDVSMTLSVTVDRDCERWLREFDGRGLRSIQWAEGDLLVEQAGPLRFAFRLSADESGMYFNFQRASLWRIPLPGFLSPGLTAVAVAEDAGWRADIRLSLPWGAPVLRYNGLVIPDAGTTTQRVP